MHDDPAGDDAAADLAAAVAEFAGLADIGGDAREVSITVAGPGGLPLGGEMTARTAAWLAEIVRQQAAAIAGQLDDPQDDVGFDVWGE